MTTQIATLPMYDWPEVRPATDALWVALRNAFRGEGIAAPDTLDRATPVSEALESGVLLLGQTCGLPYVQGLCKHSMLLGAPDYGVPGCAPGEYRSVIVARNHDDRENLNDFKGSCFALSSLHSQSGYAAMLHELLPLSDETPFFSRTITSGGHPASIKLVADGTADIATIDYVTWRLARQFMPEAALLREIALTTPVPGLPLIAASGCDRDMMQELIGVTLGSLPHNLSEQTGIKGFTPYRPDHYDVIAERFNAASTSIRLN